MIHRSQPLQARSREPSNGAPKPISQPEPQEQTQPQESTAAAPGGKSTAPMGQLAQVPPPVRSSQSSTAGPLSRPRHWTTAPQAVANSPHRKKKKKEGRERPTPPRPPHSSKLRKAGLQHDKGPAPATK
ncbi:hypothetical protein NDU88_001021 [Pleurodeles waltl]|uniref:Uncharacterized protein n=1 Tax=Pleurodeles waltl TaxID=8319 RepID=A0AAV7V970_PLEWA|nr:hypothetical protein NDU88_001021 [Pleurodeles waltl]